MWGHGVCVPQLCLKPLDLSEGMIKGPPALLFHRLKMILGLSLDLSSELFVSLGQVSSGTFELVPFCNQNTVLGTRGAQLQQMWPRAGCFWLLLEPLQPGLCLSSCLPFSSPKPHTAHLGSANGHTPESELFWGPWKVFASVQRTRFPAW